MEDNANKLTLNQQQYIETIHSLCGRHEHAHAKDIAAHLDIRMPSVTEALRALREMGLVNYQPRQAVTLTPAGELVGQELQRRHQLLRGFFREIMGCTEARAELFACRIEHVIDDEFSERMASFCQYLMEKIEVDGHNPVMDFKSQYRRASQLGGPRP